MPSPFDIIRRLLPLQAAQDQFRTPDFNPESKPPVMPRLSRPLAPDAGAMRPPASMAPPVEDERVPIPQLPGRSGQMTPYSAENKARYEHAVEGARNEDGSIGPKVRRSGGDIGRAALMGLQRGGLVGALTGALGGVIDPAGTRERNFNDIHLPRLQRAQASQQQEEAQRQAQAIAQLNLERAQVGLDQERAQTDLYKAQSQKALNPAIKPRDVRLTPLQMPDGSTVLVDVEDPANAGKQFSPVVKPQRISPTQQRAESEMEREAAEGSPEEIAESSYQARGGDNYVFSKLPARIQEILQKGTVEGDPASPEEIESADRLYQQAITRQRRADIDYTKGVARGRTSKRAVGKRGGPSSASGTRSLRELESKYFGGR